MAGKSGTFELEAENDIVCIVMLEIHGATDLLRLRNGELVNPLLERQPAHWLRNAISP